MGSPFSIVINRIFTCRNGETCNWRPHILSAVINLVLIAERRLSLNVDTFTLYSAFKLAPQLGQNTWDEKVRDPFPSSNVPDQFGRQLVSKLATQCELT